jgi:hypothetical protein
VNPKGNFRFRTSIKIAGRRPISPLVSCTLVSLSSSTCNFLNIANGIPVCAEGSESEEESRKDL